MTLKRFIIGLVVLLGLAIPVLASDLYWMWIPFISHSEEYPIKLSALFMAVSAFITLLLALTAIRTIEESNKREESSREERRDIENRDRTERYINEIIEWLKELQHSIFPSSTPQLLRQALDDKKLQKGLGLPDNIWSMTKDIENRVAEIQRLDIEIEEGKYILNLASEIQTNGDWHTVISELLRFLRERKQIITDAPLPTGKTIGDKEQAIVKELTLNIEKSLEGITLSEEGRQSVLLGRNAGLIRVLIPIALERALAIKTRLLIS